jgi:hypothetical protein
MSFCVNGYVTVGAPCNDTNIHTFAWACDANGSCAGAAVATLPPGCNAVCTNMLPGGRPTARRLASTV